MTLMRLHRLQPAKLKGEKAGISNCPSFDLFSELRYVLDQFSAAYVTPFDGSITSGNFSVPD